jgi:hypothetical protein
MGWSRQSTAALIKEVLMRVALFLLPLLSLGAALPSAVAQERIPTPLTKSIAREAARLGREAAIRAEASARQVASMGAQAALQANDDARIRLGGRLRVTVKPRDSSLVGALVALDDTTLTLDTGDQMPPTTIRRGSIAKVEVSTGRGASYGLLAGVGIGAVVGIASHTEHSFLPAGCSVTLWALILAPLGGLVGAAVVPERWEEVPAERLRVEHVPLVQPAAGLSLASRRE